MVRARVILIGLLCILLVHTFSTFGLCADSEWTIMVFMNGDNNLEGDGIKDFLEMAAVGSTDDVNVVVQFDRAPRWSSAYGDWEKTLRFHIKKNMKPEVASAVEDLGEVNMGDGAALKAFVQWAKTKYPAKRYMLDIWDHGQGWRFFETVKLQSLVPPQNFDRVISIRKQIERNVPPPREGNTTETSSIKIPLFLSVHGTVKYVSSDDTSNGDYLYNREIQDSLKSVLGAQKLDVIGFDACLMSMMETAYAMRDLGSVMVGSEELEPGQGWNYSTLLQELTANSQMDAASLGKKIVESYQLNYQNTDTETTLSAIDLTKINVLSAAISSFSDNLSSQLQQQLNAIKSSRSMCLNYAPGYHLNGIDLSRFCEVFNTTTTDQQLKTSSAAVVTALQNSIIANYAGADRQGNYGSKGIAIYFPESKVIYDGDPDKDGYLETNTNNPVEFVVDHSWDNFLMKYLAKVP